MSAPPLPAAFGNYALGDSFVEIVPPTAVSWLPQTTGWLFPGAILLALLARCGWRALRRWYGDRYRREAARKLRALGATMDTAMAEPADSTPWLRELNRLLKLTALAAFPRPQVARLAGEEWVAFLNSRCQQPPFTATLAPLLARGPYTAAAPDAALRRELLAASLLWVSSHRGAGDV